MLPLNSGGDQCFGLAFHTRLISRASWYAPPDTGVSNLILVALERLLSTEGATEIQMGCSFSRVHGFLYEGKLSAARLTDEVDNVT